MSKLVERYPHVQCLPASDEPIDDETLLRLLHPYLDWVLAEVDTASLDVLICTPDTATNTTPKRVVLLQGRAVNLWLLNHRPKGSMNGASNPDGTPVG